ncbi:hypothetical protein ACSNOI_39765 [Actinomadura kijaniata]|uniref:hypothetical protein n=1 Tax=Actinomadura kijaniata TaxID=46161 RepID=UPI003F1C22BC
MINKDLPDLHILLETIDWPSKEHAFSNLERQGKFPSIPEIFNDLLSDSSEVRARSFNLLEQAINFEGGIFEATAPALLCIAAIINDNRIEFFSIDDCNGHSRAMRAALLEFLGQVVGDADDGNLENCRRSIPGDFPEIMEVRKLRPVLFDAISHWWDGSNAPICESSIIAMAPLLEAPELTRQRLDVIQRFRMEFSDNADRWSQEAVERILCKYDVALENPTDDENSFNDDPPF